MGAAFLKRLARHFSNSWGVATPNGRLLDGDLKRGLAAWKRLPPAERAHLDDLGHYDPDLEGVPPPGGVVLKAYARGLERAAGGALRIYRHPRAHLSKEPGRDHLWLTRAEWQSLIRPGAKKGDSFAVPAALVDRICRRYLIDLVRSGGNGGPRAPQNVRGQALTLTVEEADDHVLRLRLDGWARYLSVGPEHGVTDPKGREDSFALWGRLDYDRAAKAFTRFDVAALSETGHYDEVGKKLMPLGVAFVLTPARDAIDRVRPSSFHQAYFGKARR